MITTSYYTSQVLLLLYPLVLVVMSLSYLIRSNRFGFFHYLAYAYLISIAIIPLTSSDNYYWVLWPCLIFAIALLFMHLKSAMGHVANVRRKLLVILLMVPWFSSFFLPIFRGAAIDLTGAQLVNAYIMGAEGTFGEMVLLTNVLFFLLLLTYLTDQHKKYARAILITSIVLLLLSTISYFMGGFVIDFEQLGDSFYVWLLSIVFMIFAVMTSAFSKANQSMEAEVEAMKGYAGLRLLASFLDSIIVAMLTSPLLVFAFYIIDTYESQLNISGWYTLLFMGLFLMTFWVIYHAEFEKRKGWTPGKKLLGLNMATAKGRPNGSIYKRSLIKYLITPFNFIPTAILLMGVVCTLRFVSEGSINGTFDESIATGIIFPLIISGAQCIYLLVKKQFLHDKLSGMGVVKNN